MTPRKPSRPLEDDSFTSSYDTERSLREDSTGFDAADRTTAGGTVEDARVPSERADSGTSRHERISARAYQRYLERGGEHGQDVDDWLEAEREMSAEDLDDAS